MQLSLSNSVYEFQAFFEILSKILFLLKLSGSAEKTLCIFIKFVFPFLANSLIQKMIKL
jgi:hypothetical protein